MFVPNLTLGQRLSHFSAIFTYFSAYQKLIYLLIPSIYLLTGILPVRITDGLSFILHWLPYFLLTMVTNIALGRGYYKYFEVEKFNTVKMAIFIKASLSLFFSKDLKFNVTPKTVDTSIQRKERRELRVQVIILAVILISVLLGSVNAALNVFFKYPSVGGVIAAVFWALFNCVIIFAALRDVFVRMFKRKDYRFPLKMQALVSLNGREGQFEIEDISLGGLSMAVPPDVIIADHQQLNIHLVEGELDVSGTVAYIKPDKKDIRKIGVTFDELSFEKQVALNKLLYIKAPRIIYEKRTIRKPLRVFVSRKTA